MVQSEIARGQKTAQHAHNALHDLGYKIFLDRYAQKDMTRTTLTVGDTVIVVVDAATGQREVGKITALALPQVTIELLDGTVVTRDVEHVDKPIETTPEAMMERVARGIAQVETTPEKQAEWAEKFRWLLDGWKFVPGGRILTGAGTDQNLTYFNCYVISSPQDSREGIIKTLGEMTEIMSRGGGVGINISSLRPRHAYVKGVNGRSSGAVSWGALYSFVTGLIEQGGCFGPDERILTDRGLIPATELADRMDAGEVFYAHTHKGLRKITARFRNGVKPLYEVTTARGYKVRITQDHKVAVLDGADVVTIPLRELEVGDEILLLLGEGTHNAYVPLKPVNYERSVMSTTLNEEVTFPELLDEDAAYLIGYMHGDGYVHMGKKVNWQAPKAIKMATADAYPAIRQRLISVVSKTFGVTPTIENGDGAVANVCIYSRLVIEWMIANQLLKAKSGNIRVPEAIFRSPSSVMGAFIAGYFDADGCNRGRKGGYGFDSISLGMLQDVQQLLAVNGILSHIHTTDRSALGWQNIHRLCVTGHVYKQRFSEFVPAEKVSIDTNGKREENTYPSTVWTALGTRSKYRQRIWDGVSERISPAQLSKIRARLVADGQVATADHIQELLHTMPDPIISVEPLDMAEVYDFEVDDVHLLSGNGIYTSNSRRGALMLILNDWHPDVFDFINSKRKAGNITNANISVGISDTFMECLKADGDWDLMFPDTSDPAYDTEWDGQIEPWIAAGHKVVKYRTIKARELWNALVESAWASAEPGIWFRERSNKMSNSYYYNPLISTNPCVTGDTPVATEHGYTKARDLQVGMRIRTPAGLKPIEKIYNNGVQRIYRVMFSDGGHLDCTGDHKLKVVREKRFEWVAVEDLQEGDRVQIMANEAFGSRRRLPEEALAYIQKRQLNVPDFFDRNLGFMIGAIIGDGTLHKTEIRNSHGYQCRVAFGANEPQWLEVFQQRVANMGIHTHLSTSKKEFQHANGTVALHQSLALDCYKLGTLMAKIGMPFDVKAPQKTIPNDFMSLDREFLAGLLDGLFSTDGGVDRNRANPMLRFHTSSQELAQQVRLILLQFGIHARVYKSKRKRDLMYDDRSMYGTGLKYDVLVMNEGIAKFYAEIGLSHPEKAEKLQDIAENTHFIGGSWTVRVKAVEDTGREEEVYDVFEPDTLTWITNGYVSLDCGEQSLGAYSVCNLGAINLARFYDADADDVAWDDLRDTVRYAVRFLDNVIDSTPYFMEENARVQGSERRVGLGTMGIAELMIRLKVRYGSEESLRFIDQIYKFITVEAYKMSAEIAAEKGAFSAFDADQFLASGFMQIMPDDVRDLVKRMGIRNVTLVTQAPTGTTGTMVNTSTGIEPFFSWVYYRKSRLGLHEEKVPVVQEWYEANPGATDLPDYFVTAMDLTPEEHVRVQAAFQRWIDSSISKTANLPNDYTVEQVGKLYEYMYELGCKGGTVYRDGSRDEQVLMLKGDERAEKEMERKTPKAEAPAEVQTEVKVERVATPHRVYPRPKKLTGITVNTDTPFGTAYITMNSDQHGYPFEVFITAPGKAGSDLQADAEGLGRMISLSLRTTDPHNRRTMLRLIIEQLRDIGGARSVGFGQNRVTSLPDAVARALEDHFFADDAPQQLGLPITPALLMPEVEKPRPGAAPVTSGNGNGASDHAVMSGADVCPSCANITLLRVEGCRKCTTCGYTEC